MSDQQLLKALLRQRFVVGASLRGGTLPAWQEQMDRAPASVVVEVEGTIGRRTVRCSDPVVFARWAKLNAVKR